MLRHALQTLVPTLLGVLALSSNPAAAQNVSGDWYVYAETTHAGVLCVPQVGDQWWYDLSLTQVGNLVGGAAWRADTGVFFGNVNGTIAGSNLSLTIVDNQVGSSTTHQFSLALAAGGETFSGVDDWFWTNGTLTCTGRDDVIGARAERRFCTADTPSACPCGNHQPAGSVGGCINSTGDGAVLHESGFPSISIGTYSLSVTNGRPFQPGIFLQGATQVSIPFLDGRLCMGNPTVRLEVVFLDAFGAGAMTTPLPGGPIAPFSTRHYQFWYRDPGPGSPCGHGANFSDALTVLWLP